MPATADKKRHAARLVKALYTERGVVRLAAGQTLEQLFAAR